MIGGGPGGAYKIPLDHYNDTKEQAFKHSGYCLVSAIPGTYRLLAKSPATTNAYYYFTIKCPNCGGTLEEMLPAKDKYVLPMYACTCCNR